MSLLLQVQNLANGLRLEFFDESNRYFGDYHRVRILVRCRVGVCSEWLVDSAQPGGTEQARAVLGDAVTFERSLEQMGVAGAQLEEVKQGLIAGFFATAAGYLGSEAFPRRFLAQQLQARTQGVRRYRSSGQ